MPIAEEIIIDYDLASYKERAKQFGHQLPGATRRYLLGLFPITTWIHRYNLSWLAHDLIAGMTVGIVIVPQSMGYAKIADLPPEYGLYTAFVGLCVYCIFATSKDISIGPTAVMSLLVSQTIARVIPGNPSITAQDIAVALSLLSGAIMVLIGLVRLGILVEFIPAPAIAGFMTGSAITISLGQLPNLFGMNMVDTRQSSYLILGQFFQNLPNTSLDAAFGLLGLAWLYSMRFGCQYLSNRFPRHNTLFFFLGIMRNGILVIISTLIAYLLTLGGKPSPISILKDVPAGFRAMHVPSVDTTTIAAVASTLPSAVIVLVLEHVAIAKSFGRINDYTINPSQEILAIGFANVWASFFGAFPSTGSFSRTAIKARSGSMTPLSDVYAGIVVLLALYVLTPAFYYIPDATLAAIVIHAVVDLVSRPSYVKRLASVSFLEMLVFLVTVIVTFFTTVDDGIYAAVGLSVVILLFRIARPRFAALGKITLAKLDPNQSEERNIFLPLSHPSLGKLAHPFPPGILMCRIDESITYPNASYVAEHIIAYGKQNSRRSPTLKSTRAWNDPVDPRVDAASSQRPRLHAIIFDFSSVNRMDSSGLQAFVDAQKTLERYSGQHVEFHFVNIRHPSIRRSLILGGFGIPVEGTKKDLAHKEECEYQNNQEGWYKNTAGKWVVSSFMKQPTNSNGDIEKFTDEHHEYVDKSRRGSVTSMATRCSIPLPRDRYAFFHWSEDEAIRAATFTLVREENETSAA